MQNFLYQIKRIVRKKGNIFWTLLFPIFLGCLFYAMFGNISNIEHFSKIPVGLVSGKETKELASIMKTIENEDGTKLFEIKSFETEEEAKNALKNEEIKGYIEGPGLSLFLKESGIEASVIQVFLDQYLQNTEMIKEVAKTKPLKLLSIINSMSSENKNLITKKELKGTDKDPYAQYFYALLAMTCLIMTSVAMNEAVNLQADQTAVGARRNVCPERKMHMVLCDFFAVYFTCCVMATIVLAVCVFGFKKNFGNQVGLVLLGVYAGCFVGVAAGLLIAVTGKGSLQKKDGICITFFMVSSFLAGLQWGGITYVIEKNCPIINRINPGTLIVNSFKSLAVFGDGKQYAINLFTLLGMGILFLVISIAKLRRTKYADL